MTVTVESAVRQLIGHDKDDKMLGHISWTSAAYKWGIREVALPLHTTFILNKGGRAKEENRKRCVLISFVCHRWGKNKKYFSVRMKFYPLSGLIKGWLGSVTAVSYPNSTSWSGFQTALSHPRLLKLFLFLLRGFQVEILPLRQQGHEPGRASLWSYCATELNQPTKLNG